LWTRKLTISASFNRASSGTEATSSTVISEVVIVNSGWGGILVDKGTHDSTIARNLIGRTLNGTVVGNGTFGVRFAAGVRHRASPGVCVGGQPERRD